jgi:hypothetical protein
MRFARIGSLTAVVVLVACGSNENNGGAGGAPTGPTSGTGASSASTTAPTSGVTSAHTTSGATNATGVTTTTTTGDGASSSTGLPPVGGLGPAMFGPGDLDGASNGATITFEQIGAAGWFPSRRDPASGMCDVQMTNTCCLTKETISSDALTPWDQDLIMTLRGPMDVKQFATYQPSEADATQWELVSGWDDRSPSMAKGLAFTGNASPNTKFAGSIGSECLVNVSTDKAFGCGPGSVPYCPASSSDKDFGWSGSKLFILLASMPHSGTSKAATQCSKDATGNWYDAPWLGLSVGELVRSGAFSGCQCYAKDPAKWYLSDGCGQFNVFEVVNDNNQYKNLDVFSTNMIGYGGYVGEGPCGSQCNVSMLGADVDLIDKKTSQEAAMGAVATPSSGPGAAFRRPENGYRYFVMLLDVPSRTVAMAIIHPSNVPASIASLLPDLPASVPQATVDAVRAMRLPK